MPAPKPSNDRSAYDRAYYQANHERLRALKRALYEKKVMQGDLEWLDRRRGGSRSKGHTAYKEKNRRYIKFAEHGPHRGRITLKEARSLLLLMDHIVKDFIVMPSIPDTGLQFLPGSMRGKSEYIWTKDARAIVWWMKRITNGPRNGDGMRTAPIQSATAQSATLEGRRVMVAGIYPRFIFMSKSKRGRGVSLPPNFTPRSTTRMGTKRIAAAPTSDGPPLDKTGSVLSRTETRAVSSASAPARELERSANEH